MWVKVFMEGSQMLYASWLAEGFFYNIMLVQLQNAWDALYRTAQATAWKRVGCFPFFLKLLDVYVFGFLKIITVSESFKPYRAPHAISSLSCSCSKTSSYFGGGQLLLPTKHCMKPQLVKALVIKNNWKVQDLSWGIFPLPIMFVPNFIL